MDTSILSSISSSLLDISSELGSEYKDLKEEIKEHAEELAEYEKIREIYKRWYPDKKLNAETFEKIPKDISKEIAEYIYGNIFKKLCDDFSTLKYIEIDAEIRRTSRDSLYLDDLTKANEFRKQLKEKLSFAKEIFRAASGRFDVDSVMLREIGIKHLGAGEEYGDEFADDYAEEIVDSLLRELFI